MTTTRSGSLLRPLGLVLALGSLGLALLAWVYIRAERSFGATSQEAPAGRDAGGTGSRGRKVARDAQVARARELLDREDFAAAAHALDRALEAAPGDAEALALQVRAFRAQRRYAAARAAARSILESFPASPLAHMLLGAVSLQEGDTASARRDFERAAELDLSSGLAPAQLAVVDMMEGKVRAARERAERALALEPSSPTALRVLARMTRSVPDLISLHRRLLESSPADTASRGWIEVLEASRAPSVNYVAPIDAPVTIPWEKGPDGRLYVRADVGDLAGLRFLLDTGSSGLVISERVVRRLGLKPGSPSESAALGGEVRPSRPVLLDRFALGGVRGRDLTATCLAIPPDLDGILNPLLLAPAGSGVSLEMKFSREALVFHPPEEVEPAEPGPAGPPRRVVLPYLADGLHIVFRIMMAGRPATALLDTGSAADVMDRSLVARLPGSSVSAAADRGLSLIGLAGRLDNVEIVDEVTIRIAGRDFATRQLYVLDLNRSAFRFQVDLDALIGIDRLSIFDMRIDPGRGTLSFQQP